MPIMDNSHDSDWPTSRSRYIEPHRHSRIINVEVMSNFSLNATTRSLGHSWSIWVNANCWRTKSYTSITPDTITHFVSYASSASKPGYLVCSDSITPVLDSFDRHVCCVSFIIIFVRPHLALAGAEYQAPGSGVLQERTNSTDWLPNTHTTPP